MTRKIFSLALAAPLLSFLLLAEEKVEKTSLPALQHELVVTATRLETPVKEIASSVTVISRGDLEKTKKLSVFEVLREVMGLDAIQNGGNGAAASVLMRGSNSEHVLILLDGVEVNDPMTPSRSFDLAHLSLDNVEQIEILRGPQSTLYGSDAMAGVINIISRKGEGKAKFSLETSTGSQKTLSQRLGVHGSSGIFHYSLGISHFSSQGISAASSAYAGNREKDGYQNLSLSGRLGFRLRNNLELDLVLRSVTSKVDIDNLGGAYGDDPNSTQDYQSLYLKAEFRTLHLKNRWEQKLGISFIDSDRHHQNPTDEVHLYDSEKGMFKSKVFKMDWQHNFFLHPTDTLTFGVDYEEEQGESEYFSNGIWGPFASVFALRKAHTAGFYLQDQIRLAGQFFATLGLRLDHHSQAGLALTYRLAPAYLLEKTGTKIKATFGTGFKSPSLYQLYAPGTFFGPIGNDKLEPEKSSGWDIGVEQQFFQGKLLFGATYFCSLYQNLISFDFLQGYLNIGEARSRGIEILAEARPVDKLLLRTSYTRLDAKDMDKDAYLLRRPKDKFTASLDYAFLKKWSVHISAVYTGKRIDQDFSALPYPRVTLSSFAVLNGLLSFDLSSRMQFFFRLENILDEKYEMVYGYGTPEFSAYGGAKIQF